MEGLQDKINQFCNEWEDYYYPDKNEKCKQPVEQFLKEIDIYFADIPDNKKQQKAKLLYLKGKIMDILPHYQKSAQQILNKSIKLNPVNGDCWNTLAHVLFKRKDYDAANKAIEMALENKGKNKVSLRYQSILLRSIGKMDQERRKNVQKSVKVIKDALMLDMKDGNTWYFLGNAYSSNFFVNFKKIDELQNAIKAYNQAEKYVKHENPDLYFNRANVEMYLQSYENAIKYYEKAHSIDPSLNTSLIIKSIRERIEYTKTLFDRAKEIKQNKLQELIKNIPNSVNNMEKFEMVSIKKLNQKRNPSKLISVKILNRISKPNDIPISFLVVDIDGNFSSVSFYNTDESIAEKIKKDEIVTIKEPELKKVIYQNYQYDSLQVFQVFNAFVNGKQLTKTQFNPNMVVNQTFEK